MAAVENTAPMKFMIGMLPPIPLECVIKESFTTEVQVPFARNSLNRGAQELQHRRCRLSSPKLPHDPISPAHISLQS
jgi:hypothetical protein